MRKASISFNWMISIINKVFSIIIPLVTTPYISRVLGSEGLGIYTYCLSYSSLFIVLGQLGIPIYGKRSIAVSRDDLEQRSKLFSELVLVEQFLIIVSLFCYFFVARYVDQYWWMFAACGVGHIAAFFDISWLFEGMEDFKTIVIKNISIKIIGVMCIFLFVKNREDMYLYALCLFGANLVGNISLWFSAKKYIYFRMPSIKRALLHLRPAFFLLLPCAVVQLFEIIDKSMLGIMCNRISEVAYYEQCRKIVSLCISVITSLGIVLMPRLSQSFHDKDYAKLSNNLNKGLDATLLISIPIGFGSAAIAPVLVPWFFGSEFLKVEVIIRIAAPLLIFMGISDLLGLQMLSAIKREKVLLYINLISIFVNLILNALLIPSLESEGAMIATVIAEGIKCLILLVYLKQYLDFRVILKSVSQYCCFSIIMYLIIACLNKMIFINASIINTVILVFVGVITYGLILLITQNRWALYTVKKIRR